MDFLSDLSDWVNKKHLSKLQLDKYKRRYQQLPFPHIELTDFFKKSKLQDVLSALSEEEFFEKEADLFKFMQTNDIAKTNSPILKEFYNFISSKSLVSFVSYITEIELKGDNTDMFGSLYQNTDHLICHDDQLEGRKVAYLLYLSDFKKKEGGALGLYNTKNNLPITVAKRIVPKFGSFLFFTVSPKSFHTVEEVTANKQRIALGGWYHG